MVKNSADFAGQRSRVVPEIHAGRSGVIETTLLPFVTNALSVPAAARLSGSSKLRRPSVMNVRDSLGLTPNLASGGQIEVNRLSDFAGLLRIFIVSIAALETVEFTRARRSAESNNDE